VTEFLLLNCSYTHSYRKLDDCRCRSIPIDLTTDIGDRVSTWIVAITIPGEILSCARAREIRARERKVNALTCDADGTRNRADDVRDK